MIESFADEGTEDIYNGRSSPKARKKLATSLHPVAVRKLDMLDAAHLLDDLRIPPENRLEALKSDYKGMHSIRINGQWRIVFRWSGSGAEDVQIVDYH